MTATGRTKLYRAVDDAILHTLGKYHLTDAEVVGILMLMVAQFQRHHLLKHGFSDEDDDEDDDQEEKNRRRKPNG